MNAKALPPMPPEPFRGTSHDYQYRVVDSNDYDHLRSVCEAYLGALRIAVGALLTEREKLAMFHRGTTHWEGCEKTHRDCKRMKELGDILGRIGELPP